MRRFDVKFALEVPDTVSGFEVLEAVRAFLYQRPFPYGQPRALAIYPITKTEGTVTQ